MRAPGSRRPVRGRRSPAQRGRFRRPGRRRRRASAAAHAARFDACAVGEIGLDYHYDFSPRDGPAGGVRGAARARPRARSPGHHPYARGDRRHLRDPRRGGRRRPGRVPLLHGRRAPWRGARWTSGFYLSFAGIVTFPKADDLREAAKLVPDGSAAGRDRQPVSCAGAVSRQAQRAGPRRPRRSRRSPRFAATPATARGADACNFDRLFAARQSRPTRDMATA